MASTGICLIEGTTVAGTSHIGNIRELAAALEPGAPLKLQRDAGNPYDPWAVQVLDGQHRRLGFVSCEHNEVVARLLDGGKAVAARLKRIASVEAWTRLEMGVYLYD